MASFNKLFIVFFGLTACAPVTVYYNPDVSVGEMQNDELDCKVSALSAVPVAIKTEIIPGYWVPKSGDRDGYYVPGSSYSVDVNAPLREDIIARCMSREGYQVIEIPQCTNTGQSTVSTARGGSMAPLTSNSCAVRSGKSGWRIVNPSP